MDKKRVRSNILLVLTALIWGMAFVAQDMGMDYVGPFTFNAVRSFVGGIVLIPVIYILRRGHYVEVPKVGKAKKKSLVVLGGICCGIALFLGSSLQQIGIMYTSVGKAGFITALYILLVPIFGLFFRKKVGLKIWGSVVVALVGMYLLCVTEGVSVNKGDILVFLCAIAFSGHILVIDYFSPYVDGVLMSCIQFFTCGVLSAVVMIFREQVEIANIIAAWKPILYAGVMSCGVAYTLQIVAQKNTNPVVASLILSLESVFACLFGWIMLGQVLSPKELGGCTLVFIAIIVAQLPDRRKKL